MIVVCIGFTIEFFFNLMYEKREDEVEKTVNNEYYVATDIHRKHFNENHFPEKHTSKMFLVREILLKLFNQNCSIYISNHNDTNKFKLGADGKEDKKWNDIIYFSGNFYRCKKCYEPFESWVSKLDETKLGINFYIKFGTLHKLDVECLQEHAKHINFLCEVGMNKYIRYMEFTNFHHNKCFSDSR